jgi:alkaline phosphatase
VAADGFAADWQLAGAVSTSGELGQRDALRGSARFTTTAPTAEGTYEVTVRGAQTGVVKTASFRVSASAAPAPTTTPTPLPSPTAGAGAAGTGQNGNGSPLAMTGAALPLGAGVLAMGLLAVGVTLRLRRRRRAEFV